MNQTASRRTLARVITTRLLAEPQRRAYWLQALAAYIIEHRMFDDVALLVNDIAHEVFEQAGELTVDVTSAHRLNNDVRAGLERYLSLETSATRVVMYETVDTELVGGLIARTADHELDTSVRSALRRLTAVA